jgi:hypothetical protein
MTYTKHDLVLLRCDEGSGWWTLHLRGQVDEEGLPTNMLAGGPAELLDEDHETWSRPDAEDYAAALAALKE